MAAWLRQELHLACALPVVLLTASTDTIRSCARPHEGQERSRAMAFAASHWAVSRAVACQLHSAARYSLASITQRLDTAKGCTPPTSTGAALTRRWRRGEGVGSMCADTGARAASSILWASRVHVFARSGSARPAPVGLHMWDTRPSCRRGFPGPTAVVLTQCVVRDVRMRAWARWR